ncbi:MAG: hypothetical protein VB859_03265 [Planctomycetaceae bacterium]
MASLEIPCPECGSVLKLPDRSLLGRKGRCPSCREIFVLSEPEEIELQLADDPVGEAPLQGTSARWVEDGPGKSAAASTKSDVAEKTGDPEVGANGFPVFDDREREDRPVRSRAHKSSRSKTLSSGGTAPRTEKRTRRRRPAPAVIVGSGIVLLAIVAVIVSVARRPGTDDSATVAKKGPTGTAIVGGTATAGSGEPRQRKLVGGKSGASQEQAAAKSIRLEMVPAGANIIFHVHPKILWTPDSYGEELRFCLGPLGNWVGEQLKSLCRFPPEQIEEALVCLMLGERGTPPEVAVVVRLGESQKPSVLLEKFPGKRSDDYAYPVYLDEKHCYLRGSDGKTIAVGPVDRADEMASAVRQPAITSTGIEQLLPLTNSNRLLTVIFEPRDARNFQDVLVSEKLAPVFNLVLDWFDDEEIETVVWSLDVDEQKEVFESEILLRNHHSYRNIVTPGRLERSLQKRLGSLPVELMQAIEKMKPGQVGPYRLISRFPALMSAFVLETRSAVGDRHVQLFTRLPERAAPNIALAALLTWDESTRTDFSVATVERVAETRAVPKTVAGRLGMKIEVDFNRTPLQDVMTFISGEIRTPIIIDGDALKLSGFTKNMPQTLSKTNTPAKAVLYEIIKRYKGMVIVVDEAKKQITLMTKPVADKLELKPFSVGP